MKFKSMVALLSGAVLLTGCASADKFNSSLSGSKRLGIITAVNHKNTIEAGKKFMREAGKDYPDNKEIVNGLTHYGAWDGWKWAGGFSDPGVFEVGDIFEWTYPSNDKEYGQIRLVTKWNDDKPGGCYWKGGFRYQSGDVVCDDSPEGPKLRRENAEWLRDKFGNQKDG